MEAIPYCYSGTAQKGKSLLLSVFLVASLELNLTPRLYAHLFYDCILGRPPRDYPRYECRLSASVQYDQWLGGLYVFRNIGR